MKIHIFHPQGPLLSGGHSVYQNRRRLCALSLCFLFGLMQIGSVLTLAAEKVEAHYTITSPYAAVNWNTVHSYKTALHTHTNASDGHDTLLESIERHVECGFDAVATTDHGTVNYTWESAEPNRLIHTVLSVFGKSEGNLVGLGKSGVFQNGTGYEYVTENGDDYVLTSNGKKLLRIPYGVEHNAVSANAHVNSWFADYLDNSLSTYEDAVQGVDNAGGLCVINHPGEYSAARYELHTEDAYNPQNESYRYIINKYASLLEDYPSCIGIDINSKGDDGTLYDRKLWDILLERFADSGKNVYAIASGDTHRLSSTDSGFTYILAEELTGSAFQNALRSGTFFAASHDLCNYEELRDIASAVRQYYGETALVQRLTEVTQRILQEINDIETGVKDADTRLEIHYSVCDGYGYCTAPTQPMITRISVDDEADTIAITAENALIIRWISDGKLLATQKADDGVFRLSDYADSLGSYVRAEVFGEGGILYTQAFLLDNDTGAGSGSAVDEDFFNIGFPDFLIPQQKRYRDVLKRSWNNLF